MAVGDIKVLKENASASYDETVLNTESLITSKMTNPMTTAGDIIYGGTSGTPTRLAKGTNGQILKMGATYPAWGDPPAAGPSFYLIQRTGTDFGVSNLTDLTSASALVGSVVLPAGTYTFVGTFAFTSTAGIGCKIQVEAGYNESQCARVQTSYTLGAVSSTSTQIVNFATSGADYGMNVTGTFTLNSQATVNLRVAQQTASGMSFYLKLGSYIQFIKIA